MFYNEEKGQNFTLNQSMFQGTIFILRNEFDFWNVHGIMNTSGLLQSKSSLKGFMLTFHEHSKN